jgi:hypothetical protein
LLCFFLAILLYVYCEISNENQKCGTNYAIEYVFLEVVLFGCGYPVKINSFEYNTNL